MPELHLLLSGDGLAGVAERVQTWGATFEFLFTKFSRRRFAPPRSPLLTCTCWARALQHIDKLKIHLTSSSPSTRSSSIIIYNSNLKSKLQLLRQVLPTMQHLPGQSLRFVLKMMVQKQFGNGTSHKSSLSCKI